MSASILQRIARQSSRLWIGLFALASLISAPHQLLAAPAQQLISPSPVIYEPNVGFGGTQFRDSNSFEVRGSLGDLLVNVGAIDHSSDGSLLFVGQDNVFEGRIVGSFSLVDLINQQVVGTINFPFIGLSECRPNSLAVLPDNSKAYVACGTNGFVEVVNINPATGELSRSAPIFTGNPQSAQLVGSSIWVANLLGTNLVRIDPVNDTSQVVVNTSPFLMNEAVVDPFRPYAYISHIFNSRILIGNTITGGISRTLSFAGEVIDLQLSPSGERLYVTVDNGEGNGQDHIAVVEGLGEAEHIVATIPVGEAATFLSTNDEGSCVFTWDFAGGYRRLNVIDAVFAQLSAQPIIEGGGANGDFVSPGASPQAVYLEPNTDNLNVFSVPEGIGTAQLVVRRACSSQGTVQINYTTQDPSGGRDPAIPDVDYQPVSGVLTFAPGEVMKTIEIPIIDNPLYGQSPRSFDLALSGPNGAFLGHRFVDTVQIDDDDAIPEGADLQLSLYDSPDPVHAGEELVYYVDVRNYPTNFGSTIAAGVIVTAQLPANVAFVSAELENYSGGGGGGGESLAISAAELPATGQCDTPAVGQTGAVICNLGDINPADQGAYGAVTIRVTTSVAAAGSELVGSVDATTTSFDPFHANNNATTISYVNPPVANQPPAAQDDSASTTQGSTVTVPVLDNDSDDDGDPLTVSTVGSATHGQVGADGTNVHYTPDAGFLGNDSFTYTISDGRGGSATATVTVMVTAATRITIVLDNRPDANQNIRFTGSAPLGRFILDDNTPQDTDAYGNSRSFDLAPGSYAFTETIPTNRLLTAINCTGGDTNVDLARGAATINLAGNEQVTCTFVNEKPATIRGRVYNDRNHNGRRNGSEPFLTDWQFTLYHGDTQEIVASGFTTGTAPMATFTRLPPGDYTLCETLPVGWINSDPAPLTSPYNQPCHALTVAPGQVVTQLFGNYQQVTATAPEPVEAGDAPAEASLRSEQEMELDADTSEGDVRWLMEDPTATGVLRVFLPVTLR